MVKTKPRTNIIEYERCGYTFSLICAKCGYQAYNPNGLGIHLRFKHHMSYIEYLREINHPYTHERKCAYCNTKFKLSDKMLMIDLKRNRLTLGCSKKCNSRLTCKHLYNDERYRNKEGRKATNLKKYKVDNCFKLMMYTQEDFIQKAKEVHGNKYSYDEVEYKGCNISVKIKCNKCGETFMQRPSTHLHGANCPLCTHRQKTPWIKIEEELKKTYDYSNLNYTILKHPDKCTLKDRVIIRCRKCNKKSTVRLYTLLHGGNCKHCAQSLGEKQIHIFLLKNNIEYISQKRFNDCRNKLPLPFDFYLPNHNVCIEFQGRQHYEEISRFGINSLQERQKHDQIKRDYCKEHNIKLIEIKYDENIKEKIKENIKMNSYDNQYLNLIKNILETGIETPCRTGNKVLVKLNKQLTVDLNEGFPILTFRQIPFKGVKGELACFLKGITKKSKYNNFGCMYWNNWCNPTKIPEGLTREEKLQYQEQEDDLGNIYGFSWRHFGELYKGFDVDYTGRGVDQLKNIVETLKKNPYDRRMIMTAWDPAHLDTMGLPPCLHTWQFNYLGDRLHLTGLQRSADTILGVPADIVQGALLLHLMAQTVNMKPGTLTLEFCNCHIYDNHIDTVKENLSNWYNEQYDLPTLKLDPTATVFNFMPEMAILDDYQHGPKVTFQIAV